MRSVVQWHTANSWQSWNQNPSSSAHPTPVSSMITNDRLSMPFPGQPLPNTTHSPLAVSRGQLSSRERSGDRHLVKEPAAGSEKCATDLQPSPGHLQATSTKAHFSLPLVMPLRKEHWASHKVEGAEGKAHGLGKCPWVDHSSLGVTASSSMKGLIMSSLPASWGLGKITDWEAL